MECWWPPAPARPPYDLPNLTCLAMALEHGAVGDDIGLDLGLATGFELPGVRSWQPKACFFGRETRETLRSFLTIRAVWWISPANSFGSRNQKLT